MILSILKIPVNDNSIIQTLQNSSYAAIFTQGDTDDNDSTIILANGITIDELNKEKSKTVDKVVIRNKILNKISINPSETLA